MNSIIYILNYNNLNYYIENNKGIILVIGDKNATIPLMPELYDNKYEEDNLLLFLINDIEYIHEEF